jgi:hypothetical protein
MIVHQRGKALAVTAVEVVTIQSSKSIVSPAIRRKAAARSRDYRV